jgi:hypothetical protein
MNIPKANIKYIRTRPNTPRGHEFCFTPQLRENLDINSTGNCHKARSIYSIPACLLYDVPDGATTPWRIVARGVYCDCTDGYTNTNHTPQKIIKILCEEGQKHNTI